MHRPMYGPGVQDIPGFWTPCRGFRIPGTGTWILDSNPPYGKRWRLYILPQFLSNLTRPITHKVIFFFAGGGEGRGGEICSCNSNIACPRFEVYKTFLCVFMINFMVFMR